MKVHCSTVAHASLVGLPVLQSWSLLEDIKRGETHIFRHAVETLSRKATCIAVLLVAVFLAFLCPYVFMFHPPATREAYQETNPLFDATLVRIQLKKRDLSLQSLVTPMTFSFHFDHFYRAILHFLLCQPNLSMEEFIFCMS
jgi:hypothetical protein